MEGALVLAFACREEQATGAGEVGVWCPCMVATHLRRVHPLRHSTEHVSRNDVVSVGSDLDRIWTESGHGPETKFSLLLTLSNFD